MKHLMFVLLSVACAFSQSDNRYCNSNGTWKGITATNPAMFDGPAQLPVNCVYTAPDGMPSPGPVVPVPAGANLQAAYNTAKCGTTLSLAHGAVFNDPFNFTSKGCDDANWITITTDGVITPPGVRVDPSYVPQMAQLNIRRNSGIVLGDHIHLIGLYLTKGLSGILFQFALLQGSNKIVFDRVYVHGNPLQETQHGIVLNTGKNVGVIDSWLDEFHCIAVTGTCVDSQAVSGGTGNGDVANSGPYKIVNNFIEASTENIIFGGAQANGPGPVDAEIRRNYLFKPMSWNPSDPSYIGTKYTVKNSFELKNCSRCLIEGNVMENVWGGFTQRGYSVLLTPKNQASGTNGICPNCAVLDITMRYNYIHTAAGFMAVASAPNDNGQWSQGLHRISIHDNIADNLQYSTCYQCGFNLIELGSGYSSTNPPPDSEVLTDVLIKNNTVIASGLVPGVPQQEHALLNIGSVPPNVPTQQAHNIAFMQNLVDSLPNGMASTGGGTGNCANITKPSTPINIWKTCWTGQSPFEGNSIVGYTLPQQNWPPTNVFAPNWPAVGFADFANAVYLLPSTSPYAGTGANWDAVTLATFGVKQ